VFPSETNATDEEARPWRAALGRVMSPDVIFTCQLPIMVKEFTAQIRACASREGEEVLWHNEARFMAYSVASRAALGDAVSKKDVQRLFPHMLVYGRATMALVRTFTHFPSQVAHCHMLLVAGRTIRHCWRCSTSHPWKCSAAPSTPGHPLPM
jgi:hypothetical protein